jgi:predicted dehydrogenase
MAVRSRVPLMCGFVERHNPVAAACIEMLDGPVHHVIAQRHSPPADRIRSSVVGDLLIHDVDFALRLIDPEGEVLPSVSGAASHGPAGSPFLEVADCTLQFPSGAIATCSASRIGHRKVRSVTVLTERSLYELDLLRQDITVYRHVAHGQLPATNGYRMETVVEIPFVKVRGEPLALQLDRLIDLVHGDAPATEELRGIWRAHEVMFSLEEQFAAATAATASTSASSGASVERSDVMSVQP